MADQKHLELLRRGVVDWNNFRYGNTEFKPNLHAADLRGNSLRDFDLREADLSESLLQGCSLVGAVLTDANLTGANLQESTLNYAYLLKTNASGARFDRAAMRSVNMKGAILRGAVLDHVELVGSQLTRVDGRNSSFRHADLRSCRLDAGDYFCADFREANMSKVSLVGSTLRQAKLERCRIYGISAWDVDVTDATQEDLTISRDQDSMVTVDSLEVAQFLYLIINNSKLRTVIDTITSKVVLILGRFTPVRKGVLDSIKVELRKHGYIPVLFDFDGPLSRDTTSTVEVLARLARFVIADLTDPSSIPHELASITPFLRTTPIAPIRLAKSTGYAMFEDFCRSYDWVMETKEYENEPLAEWLAALVASAEKCATTLRNRG